MTVFDKNDVYNYIFGGEFADGRLEELESDRSFMLSVISTTKDKKMLNICDDVLLGDLSFLRGLLNIFKSDRQFCYEIIELFRKKNNDPYDNLCVDAILVKDFNRKNNLNDEVMALAKTNLNARFLLQLTCLRIARENNPYFSVFQEEYSDYPELILYFAKRLASNILDKIPLDQLDVTLHYNFDSKEEAEKMGNKRITFMLLMKKDSALAKYYLENPIIASEFDKTLDEKLSKWDDIKKIQAPEVFKIVYEYVRNEATTLILFDCISKVIKKYDLPELNDYLNKKLGTKFKASDMEGPWYEDQVSESEELLRLYNEELNELYKRVEDYLQTFSKKPISPNGKQKKQEPPKSDE